jgi:adenylate cyclase
MEIERKWRLRQAPPVDGQLELIEQAYLSAGAHGVHVGPLDDFNHFLEVTVPDSAPFRLKLTHEAGTIVQQVLKPKGPPPGEVRVRRKGSHCLLTVKSEGQLLRLEEEREIPEEILDLLASRTCDRIVKDRTTFRHEGRIFELDRFKGRLSGLLLLEVEFATLAEAGSFVLPALFEKCGALDVTADPRFKNKNLAKALSAPQV